jgi:AraC-like DNA-binding protein
VSVRCLRREFHRQVGMSTMAYLREVRLARAHDDLVHGDAADTTVAAVAHRWGYTRPARFTQRYQNRYKITPCETLRRPYRR